MPGHLPPTSPTEDDEELRTGVPRQVSHRRLLLAVAALVLVAGAVVVVIAHGRSGSRHAVPAATAPARPPTTGPAVPLAARCPAGATCSTARDLPFTTLTALRAAVPGAVISSSVSLLANRPGHFEPDLVARRVEALAGDDRLTLLVAPAPPGVLPDRGRLVRAVPTRTGAVATGRVDGYLLSGVLDSGRARTTARGRAAAVRTIGLLVTSPALTDAQ